MQKTCENNDTEKVTTFEALKAQVRDLEWQLSCGDPYKCLICLDSYLMPLTSIQCGGCTLRSAGCGPWAPRSSALSVTLSQSPGTCGEYACERATPQALSQATLPASVMQPYPLYILAHGFPVYVHTHSHTHTHTKASGAIVEAEGQALSAGSHQNWGPYLFQVLFPGGAGRCM